MQFVDYLPAGCINKRWTITKMLGDNADVIRQLLDGKEATVDLALVFDNEYLATVRVLPNLIVTDNLENGNRIELNPASAFFLDVNRNMTDEYVNIRVVIDMEETNRSENSWFAVMWPSIFEVLDDIPHVS